MGRIASIDVDVQNCFTPVCPDELPVVDGHLIADALNAQASLADVRVMTKDAHTPLAPWVVARHDQMLQPLGLKNADVTWVAHAVPGTKGFELIDGLPPVLDYDFVVYKGVEPEMHPYGACYHDLAETLSTGLIEWLRQQQVTLVLVGGLALDYCVKTTAMQLRRAGFDVVVNLAATRGIAEATVAQALEAMRAHGIQIVPGQDALTAECRSWRDAQCSLSVRSD